MLVFQHYTGDIRSNRLSNSGVWRGVESLGLQNVMNGSSLAGTSYEINNVLSVITLRYLLCLSTLCLTNR